MTTLDELPDDDLLKQEPPSTDQFLERVEFFARCLAYAAHKDIWSPRIRIIQGRDQEDWRNLERDSYDQNLRTYLDLQWSFQHPKASFLETFDYLKKVDRNGRETEYLIGPKAFELLNQPLGRKIFISYRRMTSSVFALLLSDRLKAKGFDVFVDLHNIEPAEAWWKKIEAEILLSDVFVALIAPETLKSQVIKNELRFALDNEILAVPIWHNGYSYKSEPYPDFEKFLTEVNAIVVESENVLQYENALARLIQYLQTGNP